MLGLILETIKDGDRTHLELKIIPSIEEYQKALEENDPAAAWIKFLLEAMKEGSGGLHYYPHDLSNKEQ